MTSGGISSSYFPENQLTKFIAVSNKISMTQHASFPPRMDAPVQDSRAITMTLRRRAHKSSRYMWALNSCPKELGSEQTWVMGQMDHKMWPIVISSKDGVRIWTGI